MSQLKEKKIKNMSIDEVDKYLEDKGYCTIKISELEYLENITYNHPG